MNQQAPNQNIRLMVADANHFYRDGLRIFFEGIPGLELIAEVSTAADAVTFAQQKKPDVILIELKIPPLDGVTATKKILAENPNCKVIILTTSDDKTDIFNALQAGATGYFLKGITYAALQRSIHLIAAGNAVFDSHITDQISSLFSKMNNNHTTYHFPELTHRENEVLTFVAKGLKNKQIAAKCDIKEKTVRNHVTNILSKLGASNRSEAISRLQSRSPSFSA